MESKNFLGCGLKFPIQIDARTGKLAMVSGEDDIREAIGILLRTNRGERVMRPDYGSNVLEYMFSPSTLSTAQNIAYDVKRQLSLEEPRITDIDVQCRLENEAEGSVIVEVSYTVSDTNNRYNHVYPFYVTEGSEGGGAK